MIQAMQANLADYVSEEMSHIDLTMAEQGCYAEVVSRAIMRKLEAEETLPQYQQDQEVLNTTELEEEFLVTRTVSAREVLDDFENWVPSITAEFDQLVRTKQAVEQIRITKRSLQDRAQREGKTIELLPAKMVCARKSGVGVRRSRAVVCGNYSESRFNDDCYAGGADGCQIRALGPYRGASRLGRGSHRHPGGFLECSSPRRWETGRNGNPLCVQAAWLGKGGRGLACETGHVRPNHLSTRLVQAS